MFAPRVVEGSILFLKILKVFRELGFNLCITCLTVFESFDLLPNRQRLAVSAACL